MSRLLAGSTVIEGVPLEMKFAATFETAFWSRLGNGLKSRPSSACRSSCLCGFLSTRSRYSSKCSFCRLGLSLRSTKSSPRLLSTTWLSGHLRVPVANPCAAIGRSL